MKITFSIIYTDEDGNYFLSPLTPGYLADVFAYLRNESYEEFVRRLPMDMSYSFERSIEDETDLYDLVHCYISHLGLDQNKMFFDPSVVCLRTESEYVHFLDYRIKIKTLFKYYERLEELNLFFVFSLLQGDIWRDGNIRYYMQSHEEGHHHLPHVHVNVNHEYSASINIADASIIAGRLPRKYEKQILEKVENNKNYLFECWNKMTDGLKVDINYGLGITHFLTNRKL